MDTSPWPLLGEHAGARGPSAGVGQPVLSFRGVQGLIEF